MSDAETIEVAKRGIAALMAEVASLRQERDALKRDHLDWVRLGDTANLKALRAARARAERAEQQVAALREELEERGCWEHASGGGFVCMYCGAEWKGDESVHGGACRWTSLVADTITVAQQRDARLRAEALEEIRRFAVAHHADQPAHVLLHALTVDIPEMVAASSPHPKPQTGSSLGAETETP